MSHSSCRCPEAWPNCECGCGQPAPACDRNDKKRGYVKGQPMRFINGHQRRGFRGPRRWTVEDRGFETPCWIWGGTIRADGYGQDYAGGYKNGLAHRFLYQEMRGELAPSEFLDHLCRVPACVNPDHLEPVTNAENTRRGDATKLDRVDVEAIRASPLSNSRIAEAYGLDTSWVWRIRNGQGWVAV